MKVTLNRNLKHNTMLQVPGKLKVELYDIVDIKEKATDGQLQDVIDGKSNLFQIFGMQEEGKKATVLYYTYLKKDMIGGKTEWKPIDAKEALKIYKEAQEKK